MDKLATVWSTLFLALTLKAHKDVLGLYLDSTEGTKYWLSVLTELENRGLNDVFILCADGLKGLPESVEAAFPEAIFQTCIVRKVRASLKKVLYLAIKGISKKWTMLIRDWEQALNQFAIHFADRFPDS